MSKQNSVSSPQKHSDLLLLVCHYFIITNQKKYLQHSVMMRAAVHACLSLDVIRKS